MTSRVKNTNKARIVRTLKGIRCLFAHSYNEGYTVERLGRSRCTYIWYLGMK